MVLYSRKLQLRYRINLLTNGINLTRKNLRGGSERRDNLQICRAYVRISDRCRVTVRVMDRVRVRVRVKIRIRLRVADCCIQTAGESDKMRINHVIKLPRRFAPLRILSCPV